MTDKTTKSCPEMDQRHREQVCRLLFELGSSPGSAGPDRFLAAYHAVIAKETLWVMSELLQYKQMEVHQ